MTLDPPAKAEAEAKAEAVPDTNEGPAAD